MQPDISLNYNSQGSNGIAGMGWSIGGLSKIERCGAVIDRDGYKGGVNLDANDKFCLDGQRLIAISGTYGANLTEYRTEIESFGKITSYSSGSVPTYFVVKSKSGQTIEYGNTADSRAYARNNTTPLAWAANRIQNSLGEYISFTYNADSYTTGEHYISQIDYTLKSGAAIGGITRTVKFSYAARPDVEYGYAGAGAYMILLNKRLSVVQTYVSGALIRTYNLSYQQGTATGRSQLISVQECGSDGICLQQNSSFQYKDSAPSAARVFDALAGNGKEKFSDFNGDGKADVIKFVSGISYVSLSTGAGFAAFTQWGSGHGDFYKVADVNGDGMSDVIAQVGTDVHAWLSTGSGFATAKVWASGISRGVEMVGDFNGDGITDLLVAPTRFDSWCATIWLSTGNQFTKQPTASCGILQGYPIYDFNGDGRDDIIRLEDFAVFITNGISFTQSGTWLRLGDATTRFQFADFNGDGKTDVYSSMGYIALSYGTGFTSYSNAKNNLGRVLNGTETFADFNGDGRADIVQYVEGSSTQYLFVAFSTSTGGWFSPFVTWGSGLDTNFQLADFNGDGKTDVFRSLNPSAYVWYSDNFASDTLTTVTANFGFASYVTTQVTYKPLTDATVYTKGTGAMYPVKDVQEAKYVVSSFSAINGVGGMNTTSYKYAGMKENQTGRGNLGFQQITITAPDNSVTTTSYLQDFPYTGIPLSTSTAVNGVSVSSSINWIGVMAFDGTTSTIWQPDGIANGFVGPVYYSTTACTVTATRRCYPWVAQVDSKVNELTGVLVSSATTRANTPDAYGNMQNSTAQSSDGFITSSSTTFYNDATNWRLGLPVKATVTSTMPAAFSSTGAIATGTRTTISVYDAQGRVIQEVAEPATNTASSSSYAPTYTLGANTLVTSYTYDVTYGYRSSATVSGLGVAARTTSTVIDFINNTATTTNAVGHSEVQTIDPRFGVVTSLKGPNNLYTYWDYDGFGRKIKERRADGTFTTFSVGYCGAGVGGCSILSADLQPAVSWAASYSFDKLDIEVMAYSKAYYDILGREIRANAVSFNDQLINKDTVYDRFGRVSRTSGNYFDGSSPQWSVLAYDELGRAKTVTGPDGAVTTTTYSGLTTTVTLPVSNDGKVRTKTEKKTSTGLLDTVTDALNGKIVYQYDAFGNLGKVTNSGADGKTSTITTTYDIRGRKTAMTDPDMGSWTYTYNTFGELTSQKDAKAQTVTMSYDLLGRMLSRTELEGTSTWIFDTAANGKGRLAKVTGPTNQFQRLYFYNSLGRVTLVGTSINGELFNVGTSYNANTGRVESTTYPTAGGASLVVYNNYTFDHGYLKSVTSGPGGTGTVYWQATAVDVDGNLTAEALGNGVTTTRTFDPLRGLLTDIDTTGPLGMVQDLHYDYFTGVPNLSRRIDNQRAYTENFTYDALSRLTGVTGSRTLTYTYDSLGNFSKKSDFGDVYTYGQEAIDNFAGPHAVTTVTKGTATVATYKYDKNGNQFTGGGRTTAYTSYNLPKTVSSAAENMSFAYDADHQRIIHVSNGNTMLYLSPRWDTGTHYTKETKSNGTVEHKHYIYAGGPVALYTVTVAGTTVTKATHYLHRDHLGSVQSITDSTGKVSTVYRYDPFGKQELVTGLNTTTHHGYTGHEMHNGAGFIHMNGRTYDPSLGRFMQSDPNIDGATNLQGFNRYSYVQNNPLSFTDPSGYFSLGGLIKSAVKSVTKTFNRIGKGLEKSWLRYRSAIITVAVISIAASTGGAAYAAMGGGGWAAGAAAGAASGAFMGAVSGYAATGNLAGAMQGAIQGGAAGAVSGAIGGAFGKDMLSRMMSGSLNGFYQTGSVEGFVRGAASGMISTDLGIKAYGTSKLANLGIGMLRDGIRGGIIDGEAGALRGIRGGLVNNAAGHLLGYTMQKGWGAPTFSSGAYSYNVTTIPLASGTPAITLGNVVSFSATGATSGRDPLVDLPHELGHAGPQSALGVSYLPLQAASQWSGLYNLERRPYQSVDPYQ